MAHHLTTCTFCGVGCGLYLETAGNQIVGVYPSMTHPANAGKVCLRGWHVHEVASSPDRLKMPLIRREGKFVEATWDEAFAYIAQRLRDIYKKHGSEALAFLNSPRCSNEESYLLQKLARTVFGTNNLDHGTGVYSNNSVNVLRHMIGVPATTNSIAELAQSEVILVDGVDLGRQLPTIGGWVIRAKLNGAKLIVVDPRRHRVSESADCILQIAPRTEAMLYGAMAKVIMDRGLMNLPFIRAHCRDYEAFLATIGKFDLLSCAASCGVRAEDIESAALAVARAKSVAFLYSTGIEARDPESIQALVNLALLTGHLGREGAGIYALTEHNNLQGVCDMGMLPDRLPGFVPVSDDAGRARLEALWKTRLPAKPGLNARAVLTPRDRGAVRALWLCRYDPVSTALFGDAASVFKELEFIVVQHLFMTGTAQHADVVLPVTAFGEEQVTFTSTERRIQIAAQAITPPSGPTPAWQQLARMAQVLGAGWGDYKTSAEVMDEIGQAAPDYGGASYDNLAREYGRQWPCPKDKPLGTRYLFEDGLPQRGFRFVPVELPPPPVRLSREFPLTLVFGHSHYYWHQNVLVRHSETLKREHRMLLLDYPNGFVEMHTDDAKALDIRDGQRIRLQTAAGDAVSYARVTSEVRQGTIFVPFFVREAERQLLGGAGNGHQPVAVRVLKYTTL